MSIREYHGLWQPAGNSTGQITGTGAGDQIMTRDKPAPVTGWTLILHGASSSLNNHHKDNKGAPTEGESVLEYKVRSLIHTFKVF